MEWFAESGCCSVFERGCWLGVVLLGFRVVVFLIAYVEAFGAEGGANVGFVGWKEGCNTLRIFDVWSL